MAVISFLGVLIVTYVMGSIPFGLVFVRLFTGQDIRQVQSGRTGGTNAMRAAGFWVGILTVVFDVAKGAGGVWIAEAIVPGNVWLKVLGPIMVILGHNYSIFLIERAEKGGFRLRGGAGGAPCVGGSMGLWAPSILIIVPLGAVVFFGVGYASVATMSVALLSSLVFAGLALTRGYPWEYVVYGLLAEGLLIWALLPNIKRLIAGTERPVGLRARRKKETEARQPSRRG